MSLFLQRMGLEPEESEKVDELTSVAQMSSSWIQVQANLRSQGLPGKLTKGEAAIVIMIGTIDASSTIDDEGILILLKGIAAIYGYQYQKNLNEYAIEVFRRPETYERVADLIDKNNNLIENQFNKSLDLYSNRGWLEKILG
tara:strand:- start:70 stop:495 length:426 start_codon:yes stop_codon:yes gene_type:complete